MLHFSVCFIVVCQYILGRNLHVAFPINAEDQSERTPLLVILKRRPLAAEFAVFTSTVKGDVECCDDIFKANISGWRIFEFATCLEQKKSLEFYLKFKSALLVLKEKKVEHERSDEN